MNTQNGGQRVGCNGDCNQGRACDCMPVFYADEAEDRAVWDWITDMTPTWRDVAGGLAVLGLVAGVAYFLLGVL